MKKNEKLIYEKDGFKAEVKIIRDHDILINVVLVKGAFGESWVFISELKKQKHDITKRTKRNKE